MDPVCSMDAHPSESAAETFSIICVKRIFKFSRLTGRLTAESMNTVSRAVLIEVSRSSWVSAKASCKSAWC